MGSGPSGLFHHLLLTRYLPTSFSRLCIDAAPHATTKGHADGVLPRTLEVLQSLGLANEILEYGNPVAEQVNYKYSEENGGIERVESGWGGLFMYPFGRYRNAFWTYNQGRVEGLLEEDLGRYGGAVKRGTRCVGVVVDEGEEGWPLLVTMESEGVEWSVRSRYVVGADGAHSVVRRSLGVGMVGQSTDDVYGAVDFVADSDHPDLWKVVSTITPEGTLLQIPREVSNLSGERLTRVYVPFSVQDKPDEGDAAARNEIVRRTKDLRTSVTLEMILQKVEDLHKPFRMKQKPGLEVEWWACYQVGQRVASKMALKDSSGHARVFLIGDAAHTHSPYLGQGMNVSMADAFDLSWKLAHVLTGLAPDPKALLDTFEYDRREVALNLIDTDSKWYATRYGKGASDVYPVQAREEMMTFIAGTNLEYRDGSLTVDRQITANTNDAMATYLRGRLREGRKMADCLVTRHASSVPGVHLQDEIKSDGRYAVIVFTGDDLLRREGRSARTLGALNQLVDQYSDGLVKVFVLHSLDHASFARDQLPDCARRRGGWYTYAAGNAVYEQYGVHIEQGAIVVLRPDHVIGSIAEMGEGEEGLEKIGRYLQRLLVKSGYPNGT